MRSGYVAISHDSVAQKFMDKYKISWHVQYELARGVCTGLWSWADITHDKVRELAGRGSHEIGTVMGKELGEQNLHIW